MKNVELNVTVEHAPGVESPTHFTHKTNDCLADTSNRCRPRTHAELDAAKYGSLPPGAGLSMRMPMACQGDNGDRTYKVGL